MPDDAHNAYVFERAVTFLHSDGTTSAGRIDLYCRGSFVLEAKQGTEQAVKPAVSKRKQRQFAYQQMICLAIHRYSFFPIRAVTKNLSVSLAS